MLIILIILNIHQMGAYHNRSKLNKTISRQIKILKIQQQKNQNNKL